VIIGLGLLLAFIVGRQKAQEAKPTEICDLIFTDNIKLLNVPIAKSLLQIRKGLSKKKDAGQGMLFFWDKPEIKAFWMHNTWIPLQIAFIKNDGTIIQIKSMVPKTKTNHISINPVTYALELAEGQFKEKGLSIGSRLIHRDCRPIKRDGE